MKISIITVTKNNKKGLIRAIKSVGSQTYKNVENIIVDGGSNDGSVEAIKNEQLKIKNFQFISERDSGIYDAINKGIKLATGDVIGLLHSDDFYKDEFVLEKYAETFAQRAKRDEHSGKDKGGTPFDFQDDTIDAVYSDLVYVRNEKREVRGKDTVLKNTENSALNIEHSVIRYWQAGDPSSSLRMTKWLENGWMPPHPTLFIKKSVFKKFGLYRTDMKIAADYEMILRLFYKHKITAHYLPITTYCMTIGGASNKSLKNIFIKSSEDYRAMKMHSLPNPFKTILCKNISKLPQFFSGQ